MSAVRTTQEGSSSTKEEWEAIKTLREDPSHVVLTVDKGVALVVMDKRSIC